MLIPNFKISTESLKVPTKWVSPMSARKYAAVSQKIYSKTVSYSYKTWWTQYETDNQTSQDTYKVYTCLISIVDH